MAGLKKIATAPKAPKKPRAKKSLSSILGDEPRLIMPTNIQLSAALNWYNRVADNKEQRIKWVLDFMKAEGHYSVEEMAEFKRKGKKFIGTFSALARMLTNGCVLEDRYTDLLNGELAKFVCVAADDDDELDEDGQLIVTTPVKTVKRDRTYGLVCDLVEFIDGEMDRVLAGEKVDSLYTKLTAKNITVAAARDLKNFYKPQAFEFFELNKGKDAQLNEGYAHLNKKTRKAICDWMMQLVADLASLETNKKVVRKPRAKKAPKVENIVKHVKYQKDSHEFKLVSISPAEVVGKKELWVFNTKYKQIGVYTSNELGFSFRGTTLTNATGVGKVLRKPVEFLQDFKGTQKGLQLKFKAVKTKDCKLNGRINENTILLKAY